MNSPKRPYHGRPAEERVRERRRCLLDAAFSLMDSDGWPKMTIDNLCKQARLNKRYFYESFDDLDAVAAAVVDELAAELWSLGSEVAQKALEDGIPTDKLARKALGAAVEYLTDDPRRARVLFTEISDSPQAVEHRKTTIRGLAQALSAYAHVHHKAAETYPIAELGSAMLIGGSIEAILAWLNGNIKMSREQFMDDLAALWVILGDGAADRERERQASRHENEEMKGMFLEKK
ncbi:MAG: TetR/AcrR family transcriptional regulator [Thermodesulfobacteriota bacterium]